MAGLQFSDTTSRQGLVQDCEDLCGLGATGISGNSTLLQQFTRWMNVWYYKVVTMILASQDDWDWDDTGTSDGSTARYSTYPIATTPLVASQRDYTFPISLAVMKIKRVDVSYDGTNYYKCEEWDSSMTGLGLGNDTVTDGRFNKGKPYYDVRGNSIFLYPMADSTDVSNGGKLRIEFYRYPVEFATTDTTATPGFDPAFHRMLSLGSSFDYCSTYSKPNAQAYWGMLQDYEVRLKQFYGKRNGDEANVVAPAYISYE